MGAVWKQAAVTLEWEQNRREIFACAVPVLPEPGADESAVGVFSAVRYLYNPTRKIFLDAWSAWAVFTLDVCCSLS